MHVIRVATQNIWQFHDAWEARRPVLIDGLRELAPDLVALQEALAEQPRDLLGTDFHYARHRDVAIASRWPIGDVRELESATIAAEIDAPIGRLVFVNHCPSYELDRELDRERQAVAAARLVEEMRPEHAILAGDLNARPESAHAGEPDDAGR
jgi:endonuclease/exonuclease/phosphatase family metal-dependent hydrolase